jgi:hypothetical protein
MSADEQYEAQNEIPNGDSTNNAYASRAGQSEVPVINDDAPVEDPIEHTTADSDESLGVLASPSHLTIVLIKCSVQDDKEAIDSSNIIESRTRGAAKKAGTYAEPGDYEGLPGPEDGTSSGRQ